MKILIADDSKTMRLIICQMLGQFGEGLLKAKRESPDLILSDWEMPKKNGIDFLRELRASGMLIPFGLIAGYHDREMEVEAKASGANFFLSKPFSFLEFQKSIEDYII
jgi:two-component system, chemotaxis family, chemotaxis protein CheY